MVCRDLRALLPLTLARTRDLEESQRRQISLSALHDQETNVFDARQLEAPKTAYFRDKVWGQWMQYVTTIPSRN